MSDEPKSVLIVDDHAYIRSGLRMFVESQLGMRVCGEAADGTHAVEVAKSQKPDLILMDLSMPNMNGVEASSAIRRALPDARIVVFTLFSESLGGYMAKAVGVDVVISKTEGMTALTRALQDLLTHRKLFFSS